MAGGGDGWGVEGVGNGRRLMDAIEGRGEDGGKQTERERERERGDARG